MNIVIYKKKGFQRGTVPWNKGKQLSKEIKQKISNSVKQNLNCIKTQFQKGNHNYLTNGSIRFMKGNKICIGRKPWNKGLNKEEFLSHYNGKHPMQGRYHSKETINKIKIARTKQNPVYTTSIEIKIQNFLKELNINFFTHQYINEIEHGYQCDILIPNMNLVIECDGNYFHKYPIGNDLDYIRTKELLEKGFKVLRLWEVEIKEMNINEFKCRLENAKCK